MIKNRRQLNAMVEGVSSAPPSFIIFKVTEDHIKLCKQTYVSWWDCEFGAPAIDCKRPYGNSSVIRDIANILGWEYDDDEYDLPDELYDRCNAIHQEMEKVLEILLHNSDKGLRTGEYQKPLYGGKWTPCKTVERKYKLDEVSKND